MRAGIAFDFDFETYHAVRRSLVEERLGKFLNADDPKQLWESMRYSVLSGGKRIRAVLCIAAAEAVASGVNGTKEKLSSSEACQIALPCACAIEMIHAMSLIHDDLPCMDDDDFRRGKPSNHKVFGEAMALLAGDALLVYALEVLLKDSAESIDRKNLIRVSTALAQATGAKGMVGGQVSDMSVTGQLYSRENQKAEGSSQKSGLSSDSSSKPPAESAELLNKIHERKTGAIIRFSVWSGACLMGASEKVLQDFAEFGELLGLSFQIADDLLDVTGDIKTLGKTPGKDQASGKLTWISVYGIEKAKQKLAELETRALEVLAQTELSDESLLPLKSLLAYAIHRSH